MNELTKTEKLNLLLTEQVRDMFDRYLATIDEMETFKFKLRQAMEESDVNKWETDLFTVQITADTMTTKVDTNKLKALSIYVTNAETGELEEVNAYDFFTHKVPQKGSFRMKIREEKYGG